MRDPHQTPTLLEVIKRAVEERVTEIHTALPGIVEKYDYATNTADVKPQIKRKFSTDEDARAIPIISKVPVMIYRTKGAHLRLPVAKGDKGLLIFAERSISPWMAGRGDVLPSEHRKHAYSDAMFLPALFPSTEGMKGSSPKTSVELRNETAFVDLRSNGKIRVGNANDELLALLEALVATVKGLTVTGTTGENGGTSHSHAISSVPVSSGVQSALQAYKDRLGALKG